MTNILLSAQGTLGDLVPILRIGSILQAGGDSATLVTHSAYEKVVREAGLEFAPSDTREKFEQYIADLALCETPRGNIEFQKRHVLPMAEREVALLSERCVSPDTILIGSHLLMLGPQLVAEKTGLPLIRVFWAAVTVARFALFEIMVGEVLAPEIDAIRTRMGLPKVSDWAAWARYPQRNIGAWPDWFAAPAPDWPQGLDLVLSGFLSRDELKEDPISAELDEFLQDGAPPVLITGGTGTYIQKGFYAACVEGCRRAGRRGILVTRFRESIPDPLPEQIKWFPHLPFVSLMPRLAGVIHHGGMGTLALALRFGTPQLILAMGSDRPDNAQRLQMLGVAEYLPPAQWKPELVAEALNRLVDSPTVHARCRETALRIHADDPAAAIKNVVRSLAPKVRI